MAKTVYMQIRLRTISFRSDDGPPLRLELQHTPVPAPAKQGLLSWLFGRRIEHQPAPRHIPWWSADADFVGDNSPLLNNNRPALLGPIKGDQK